MDIKMPFRFLFIGLLITTFTVLAGCSGQERQDKTSVELEKVKQKIREKGIQSKTQRDFQQTKEAVPLSKQDEMKRGKKVADAEECLKEFNSCIEKCEKKSCENACLTFLSACEKDLPTELQTLKKE